MISSVKFHEGNHTSFEEQYVHTPVKTSLKRSDFSPTKTGYTPERHTTKKKKIHAKGLKVDTSSESEDSVTEEISALSINKPKSFKELIKSMDNHGNDTSDSENDFFGIQPINPPENMNHGFKELDEPTVKEKEMMERKSFISDNLDTTFEFQMVPTKELWQLREFNRSQAPKYSNDPHHLEQVRRFILKNGFDEPLLITVNVNDRRAYICEGNHKLWVAIKEGIPHVPCRVTSQWQEPHGQCKILDINTDTLKQKRMILPEDLGLKVKD